LCALILVRLLIVNLESVRDRTLSAVNFLGCLRTCVVPLLCTCNTVSYKLRNPELNQPGFIEPLTPEGWAISITPHELTEYLFCICPFINYLLAFFPIDIFYRHLYSFSHVQPVQKNCRQILKSWLLMKAIQSHNETGEKKLCPERYVSFPSRVTFWVTELIITGYPNALQLGHLWAVDSKNLAAHVVPVFLRIIYKHLHVDISGELDASHTANSHFPAAVSNTSHDQKSGIADANLNTSIVQLRMRLVPVEAYSQNSVYLLRVLQAAKKSSRSDREICRERRILAKTYRGVYIYS
uniref:PXA domain-containing protein n=1 Tax=Hymenolepis diminuta TaxID=6216 RepID=A0A0R3SLN6_HYMDI